MPNPDMVIQKGTMIALVYDFNEDDLTCKAKVGSIYLPSRFNAQDAPLKEYKVEQDIYGYYFVWDDDGVYRFNFTEARIQDKGDNDGNT